MAWFSVDGNVAEGTQVSPTPAFNFERLVQTMDKMELKYTRDENGAKVLHSGFDGFYTVLVAEGENEAILSIYSFSSNAFLPESRFEEALIWANNSNRDTIFGTARPFVDDDKDVTMRIDASFIFDQGVSDEQLEECIGIATAFNAQILEKYCADFGIEREQPTA